LASITMSYLICSVGLIVLILVMPYFFSIERDSTAEQMAIRELTEISDYTSNTLENLYFLASSTNSATLTVSKDMIYLPLTVQDSFYTLSITSDGENATKVTAILNGKSIAGESWLIPGLKLTDDVSIDISRQSVTAYCQRNSTGFHVWLGGS
jgi:hypothetical protein